MDNKKEMTWIKIERDKDGFATKECLDEMLNNLPIILYHTKMGGGYDVLNPQNEKTKDFFRYKLRESNVYTHYLPIPKLEE